MAALRSTAAYLFVAAALGAGGACSLMRTAKPERLSDGNYRIACKSSLSQCLVAFDPICRDGYDIVRANELRERKGPEPWPAEYYNSEAIVRCRRAKALFGGSDEAAPAAAVPAQQPPAAPSPPAASAPPAPPAVAPPSTAAASRPPGCIPGATEPCTDAGMQEADAGAPAPAPSH